MKKRGFTLIELVVVMAIIAVLALLIVAAIMAARRQSITTQRIGNVKTVETALESRASRCGGNYFAAVGATAPCNAAIAILDVQDMQDGLVTGGFLSQTLNIPNAAAGYVVTANTSVANNTMEILACNFPDATCAAADAAYSARR